MPSELVESSDHGQADKSRSQHCKHEEPVEKRLAVLKRRLRSLEHQSRIYTKDHKRSDEPDDEQHRKERPSPPPPQRAGDTEEGDRHNHYVRGEPDYDLVHRLGLEDIKTWNECRPIH